MRLLWQELRSRLQYKIILPFLILTLCVAMAGSAMAFSLVSGSWQERFDNQLAQVTRAANDGLMDQERANLQFLREVATAQENQAVGAPAVATAVSQGDSASLLKALDPYFRTGLSRASVRLDRLIVFDATGTTIADLELTDPKADPPYKTYGPLDFSTTWFVPAVLQATTDEIGDKFASIIKLPDSNEYYFATIAPIRVDDGKVVGGAIVGIQLDRLISSLITRTPAAIIAMYDSDGAALSSSLVPEGGLEELQITSAVRERLGQLDFASERAIYNAQKVHGRDYQFAYTPLQIRQSSVGILGVALARDYVIGALADARTPMTVLTIVLMLMIIGLGVYIARLITRPLEELVLTARAVTGGNLARRSQVTAGDEIGLLSNSFNSMTEHLLQLYHTVQEESGRRAAIVESIVDGIVVCDEHGNVQFVNRATRRFLSLSDDDPAPARLSDIPLRPLTEGVPNFDSHRATDLYTIERFIMRVSVAPVLTEDNQRLGYVCVLQDMTAEVELDRAKNNFIGTISHELRTPLTVMRGTTDLLLRGLVGPLEDEQRTMIESMRVHTTNMTSLINNVIVIAGLDSGSLNTDLQPQELARVVDEAAWNVRSAVKSKGLTLTIDIAEDTPQVLADFEQLRMILTQLLDNSRRYTSEGGITVTTVSRSDCLVVQVRDTGRGIPHDLQGQVFNRFIRGDGTSEGINSSERGIGLGLAIVKSLVERQGGEVWLESEPGKGSTFSFTLRYANAAPNPEQHDRPVAAAA